MSERIQPQKTRRRYAIDVVQPPHRYLLRSHAKQMMDLNDDCLLKILDCLDPLNLCEMVLVCKRLYSLVQYHFRLKYKHFRFLPMSDQGILSVKIARRIFCFFGHQIDSLSLRRSLFDDKPNTAIDVLLAVQRYCHKNLKELTLNGYKHLNIESEQLIPLFKRIEVVNVLDSTICWTSNGMVNLKFLREFDFNSNETVNKFFRTNSNISYVLIGSRRGVSALLADCWRESEEWIELILEAITVDCLKCPVNKLPQFAQSSSTCLELANGTMDAQTFGYIIKFEMLSSLKLNEMTQITDAHIIGFAEELELLTEFHLKTNAHITQYGIKEFLSKAYRLTCLKIDIPSYTLDVFEYEELLGIVQQRNEGIALELTIYSDGQQVLVSKEIALGPNKKWLSVKELNRMTNRIFPAANDRFVLKKIPVEQN